MTAKQATKTSAWFDEGSSSLMIADQAQRLDSFLSAVADGKVDDSELQSQEAKLVSLMKEIEPQLSPELHGKVTELLCELTAYDLMQVMHSMHQSRPKTKFRG